MRTTTLASRILDQTTSSIAALARPRRRSDDVVTIVDMPEEDVHERPTVPAHRFPEAEGSPETERITVRALPLIADKAPAASMTLTSLPACRPPPASLALGSLDDIPYLCLPTATLSSMDLSPETMLILRLVDGRRDLETILDSCPFATSDVLEILAGLVVRRVVQLRTSGPRSQRSPPGSPRT